MGRISKPKIVAVDPGLSGAVIKYCPESHKLEACRDFKTISDIVKAVEKLTLNGRPVHGDMIPLNRAVIELVGARPARDPFGRVVQGIVSTAHFMIAYGTAMGAVGMSITKGYTSTQVFNVAPQRWQNWVKRELSIHDDTKTLCDEQMFKPNYVGFDSRVYAANCFPDQIEYFVRGKDHNTADAVMLAVYCYWFGRELALREYLTSMWAYRNGHTTEKPELEDTPRMGAAGLDKFPPIKDEPYQL